MRSQQGAALVVALLLLVVVTLLAVSGMNTASLELVMAGNTQYQQNAFRAAEDGIERTLATTNEPNLFNPSVPAFPTEPTEVNIAGFGSYTYQVKAALGGAPQPAMWTFSTDAFSSFHFEVPTVGSAVRNALAEHVQGVAVIGPKDNTMMPLGDGDDEEDDTELHFRDAAP